MNRANNGFIGFFCRKASFALVLAGGMAALTATRPAAALDLAVDAHGGTLGTGIGASLQLTGNLNVRAGINSGDVEIIDIEDDEGLNYENPAIKFDNQYAFLDLYPSSRGNFRVTVGLVSNNNEINAGAVVDSSGQNVGNTEAPVGTSVHGRVSFEGTAPYVGFGWGGAFGRNKGFYLGIDLGVMSQGDPQVDLVVIDNTNTISQQDVEQERQDLEDELDGIDLWPVINVSLGFRF
jgi:hypothetical protein